MKETHVLSTPELRRGKPSRREYRGLPRNPLHLILDGVASAANLGNILRLADAVRAERLWLWSDLDALGGAKFRKASKSMERWVPMEVRHIPSTLSELRRRGVRLLAVDLVEGGKPFYEADLRGPTALVFGNEKRGVSAEALRLCDGAVHLPMLGLGNSINVATSAAALAYAWLAANRDLLPEGRSSF